MAQKTQAAGEGPQNERRTALHFTLFFVVIITVWTAMHAYVFWRAASVPFVARHVPVWAIVAFAAALWASFFAGHLLPGPKWLTFLLERVGNYWVGALFLMLVALVAVDVITGFGFFFKSHAPELRGWGLVAAGGLMTIALVQGLRAPVVRDYDVTIAGLPPHADGMRIVGLSDLHLDGMLDENWAASRVAQANALKGDLIVVVGDVADGRMDAGAEDRAAAALRKLYAPLGVWAVFGNHETYAGTDWSAGFFEKSGLKLLGDQWVEIRPGLILAGIRDLGDVHKTLAGRPEGMPAILLAHRPAAARAAAREGAALTLSGHTHGGQIWPFAYIVGAMNDGKIAGRYDVDGMPLILCRGTGTWGPRIRLWYPGEILRVTLHDNR